MSKLRFLIIDGYAKEGRAKFRKVGNLLASEQYNEMLLAHMPDAESDVLFPADEDSELPTNVNLESYDGILWTGCNLTVFHDHDARVVKMIELAKKIYEVGVPSYGSCWGLQIAVVAAGGEVKENPKGREMGLARKIHLSSEGQKHPFYKNKPVVFDAFISHYDEVTKMPANGTVLCGNDFTKIQAATVTHKKGTFWAVQYHPEYNLHDMARLTVAREERLLRENFVKTSQELMSLVDKMEALHLEPDRKDLRWQLAIDDDVLDQKIRQCEFANWLHELVIPTAGKRK
jgi:GMP synthase (glutamine-hydrolysing)